jgi:saposin
MKLLISTLIGLVIGAVVIASPLTIVSTHDHLLGARECTWGPSFWCSNITNAKSCHAVTHCIQTVWEKHSNFPVDNDSICQICLDMVKQARDQLESNETQDELRQVFEGSCNLIPVKVIAKECDKLVDDFIPELIETLASQMEPNAVCSVAGLCNNARIDKLLDEMPKAETSEKLDVDSNKLSCGNCYKVGKEIEERFLSKNRDEILDDMLDVCGRLSSLSDGCSSIILTYFNEIYDHMKENFNSKVICHMSGVCSANYHKHENDESAELEIRPLAGVGHVKVSDDIPCELCEQLMHHMRDLLVANTTESEFKEVLDGLCKQTKTFATECLSLVDQYYDIIYQTLVNELDAKAACTMIGVCKKTVTNGKGSIMPLVPIKTVENYKKESSSPTPPRHLLGQNEPHYTNEEIMNFQLPIDKLMGAPNPELLVRKGEWCTICEYFWHFVQEALATPKNEEEIKKIVGETCDKMPKSIEESCRNFVDIYGDAIIALVIQNINPAKMCPELKLCPSVEKDMEVFSPITIEINHEKLNDKPQCPLCLLAVADAIEKVRSDKSKANIQRVLNGLCLHLPSKLRPECTDFIATYSKELIEMLATDFTPQQICVYFRLCTDQEENPLIDAISRKLKKENEMNRFQIEDRDNELMTNEIPDNTINGQTMSMINTEYDVNNPECGLCVQILKGAEKEIINNKSEDQIKHALEHACDKIHKEKVKTVCVKYIAEHEQKIVDLIVKGFAPKEICGQLGLCVTSAEDEFSRDLDIDEALVVSIVAEPTRSLNIVSLEKSTSSDLNLTATPECILCEFVMSQLEKEIANKKTEDEIKRAVLNICKTLPKSITENCARFVNKYADLIITLIDTVPPKQICSSMMLCSNPKKVESELEVLECAVCHGTVSALDTVLDNAKADDEIDMILEKACNILPAKYNKKCSDLVSIYGQSMINLLKALAQPEKVCVEIGMCYTDEHRSFVMFEEERSMKRQLAYV